MTAHGCRAGPRCCARCLFDLDGTLVDTAPEIAAGAELARCAPSAASRPTTRRCAAGSATARARSSRRPSAARSPRPSGRHFAEVYGEVCGMHATLFPGVSELLERLAADGVRLAVLTNKESRFAHRLLSRLGIADAFAVLVAGDSLPVRKPDPAVAEHALAALDVGVDEAAFVGDSVTDVRTARAQPACAPGSSPTAIRPASSPATTSPTPSSRRSPTSTRGRWPAIRGASRSTDRAAADRFGLARSVTKINFRRPSAGGGGAVMRKVMAPLQGSADARALSESTSRTARRRVGARPAPTPSPARTGITRKRR
ncbi:MAG: HAD-IA family hydrolase [Comamonadaceae bacterium]|nr:HAD-IA family hydrolase [Comamonadaceae bacterium]